MSLFSPRGSVARLGVFGVATLAGVVAFLGAAWCLAQAGGASSPGRSTTHPGADPFDLPPGLHPWAAGLAAAAILVVAAIAWRRRLRPIAVWGGVLLPGALGGAAFGWAMASRGIERGWIPLVLQAVMISMAMRPGAVPSESKWEAA